MGSHQINDEEWDKLFDEPVDLYKLYSSIRRFMDYETGIAGLKRRLSEQYFREVLTVEKIPGRNKKNKLYSRQKIRSGLQRLEKIGLIRREKEAGNLVFKLLFATWGQSVQKRNNRGTTTNTTRGTTRGTTKNTNINSLNNKEITKEQEPEEEPEEQPGNPLRNNLPLLSGNNKEKKEKNYIKKEKKEIAKRGHQLPDDFKVTEHHVELAQKNDWPSPHNEIEQFRDWHLARGTTMVDWDRAFYTWLRNAKKFNQQRKGKSYDHRYKTTTQRSADAWAYLTEGLKTDNDS